MSADKFVMSGYSSIGLSDGKGGYSRVDLATTDLKTLVGIPDSQSQDEIVSVQALKVSFTITLTGEEALQFIRILYAPPRPAVLPWRRRPFFSRN